MMQQSYHTELVRRFEESADATHDARQESERARDYYDSKQLTPEQIKTLKKRKQPIVIENLIRPKIDYLCGLERQTRTDPRAFPRTMQHEQDADAATDALRYVSDDQDWPIKRSAAFQNMLIEGYGGVEVGHVETRAGIDPSVKHIEWHRLFFDPHSSRADFSDAMFLGYITWMGFEEAKRRWPDKEAVIEATMNKGAKEVGESYDDRPRWKYWADKDGKRVRIVTIYDRSRTGQWERCVYTLSGELEECAPSPYLDEDGEPVCALIFQSAFVDSENDRYGLVRDFMTLQDEVNKRRSKFLHLSNSRQIRVGTQYAENPEAIRREMNRPDGVIVGEPGDVEIIGNGDMVAGHFTLLGEAKEAIKSVGPNATLQGKEGNDQSGRAILALQQGGMTEIAPLLDNLRHFNIRVYRAVWNRIRQLWTGERWVRVTDDESNVRFAGLNITQGAIDTMKIRDALKAGQIDRTTAEQYVQQISMNPASAQPVNMVTELDVDIEIDEAMDTPTLQIEQFNELAKLAPMAPPQYIPTMFEMLIEASNLRNKDRLKEIAQQMQQGPSEEQQAMMQIEMQDKQADIAKKTSEANENNANAVRNQTEAMKTGFETGAMTA